MRKLTSILAATAMVFSLVLTGCGSNETTLSGTSEDVYGKVTAVDGKEVSLSVITVGGMAQAGGQDGEANEAQAPDDAQGGEQAQAPDGEQAGASDNSGSTPPEIPSGDSSQGSAGEQAQAPDSEQAGAGDNSGSTPPEIPSGDNSQGSAGEQAQAPDSEQAGAGDNSGSTPPEIPSGDNSQGSAGEQAQAPDSDQAGAGDQADVPEKPSGDSDQAQAPDGAQGGDQAGTPYTETDETGTVTINSTDNLYKMSDDEEVAATLDDITTDVFLKITFDENSKIEKIVILEEDDLSSGQSSMGGQSGQGGMGGQSSGAPSTYEAVYTYSEDTEISGETLSSTGTDENVIWVNDGTTSIDGATITRTSSDSTGGDNSSFYGIGAALLTTNGTLNVSNSTITTDAAGGAGVFAYGTGVANVSDTTITTSQNTSGGIHVAGGGTLYATNVTATTDGASAAAIRSDRGGGTMRVNGGTYTSNGTGSPAIYCTADIAVENADLTATGSEALCLEGKNSVKLYNCNLTGNMQDDSQNDSTWTVILYQSMSGDAEEGSGSFEMQGGTITSQNGGLFYTTNTTSHFILEDVTIEQADDDYLLACLGNNNQRGWGSSGSNGATCTFTAIDQTLSGDVLWDSISKLDFYLTDGSVLTGAVVQDDTYAGGGSGGYANLYIESGSKWIVDGDSTLTTLYNAGTITDASGNTVSIVGIDGTVYVQGTSSYTITVSSYSTTADLSGAESITDASTLGFK